MDKTILQQYVRQYRHNNSDEFIFGYDYDGINKLFDKLITKQRVDDGTLEAIGKFLDLGAEGRAFNTLSKFYTEQLALRNSENAADIIQYVIDEMIKTGPMPEAVMDYWVDRLRLAKSKLK